MKNLIFLSLILAISCNNSKKNADETVKNEISFSADSAFYFVEKQVNFGARTLESKAHENCAEFLKTTLARFCEKVQIQTAKVELFDGRIVQAKNIIGVFNEEKPARILLCAHWDTREFSDNDKPENHRKPVLGADDGASGVGVLLEIARQLQIKKPEIGVDIVLFDAEDCGEPDFFVGEKKQNTWCLGSQYWAKNPHKIGYRARFGILLDMVGAKNAVFLREAVSTHFAQNIVDKVWQKAQSLNYSNFFQNAVGGAITDDHLYVNTLAKIPCIDIINFTPQRGFPAHWHTQNDDLSVISKPTLQAVGRVVLSVVYDEK